MPRRTKLVPISCALTGDNIIVASSATAPIHVYGIMFTVSAATNIIFKNAASAMTGAIIFSGAGSSMTLEINMDEPYFSCAPGEAFIINQSGTAQISGVAYYAAG